MEPREPPVRETPPVPTIQTGAAYWKTTDIGIFWPDAEGDEDIINKESKTYYRGVFSFTTRLRVAAQTRDPAIIRHDIALCLKGSANTWWTMELDDVTRCGLINHPEGVQARSVTVQDARKGRSVAAYAAELIRSVDRRLPGPHLLHLPELRTYSYSETHLAIYCYRPPVNSITDPTNVRNLRSRSRAASIPLNPQRKKLFTPLGVLFTLQTA
ncbi:hypothetical protein ACJ72_02432 [Emergomyces africanus]|uniref:Uncharacterized protein n=1 Tax=Emergomyces africanus TaxID=1955775 RepID=A0A1B7P2F7_9EURO|nr:hypothetical protein ACJ72_02432 [Emergomyces africanus]